MSGRIWIWGAGECGRLTRDYVPDAVGFVDSKPSLWGTTRHGLPVDAPCALERGDRVVIATAPGARDVVARLPRYVTWSLTPLWRSLDDSPFVWLTAHDEVMAGLADDQSRYIYSAVLRAWRDDTPPELGEPSPYERDLLGVRTAHRAIDGGPYDGAEIVEWLGLNPDLRVTAVDPVIRPAMRALADEHPNVKVLLGVLSEASGRVTVHDGGTATGIARQGGEGWTTDSYTLADLGPADLVKLDIEGAEAGLIDASLDYLREHLPHLAVCIYHRHSDLHTIPLAIMHAVGDRYSYHVRQHSQGLPDTVLYCVPKGDDR